MSRKGPDDREPGFLDIRNGERLLAWRWRWHLQGGSIHCQARPMQDLRGVSRGSELRRETKPAGVTMISTSERREPMPSEEQTNSHSEVRSFAAGIATAIVFNFVLWSTIIWSI